MFNEAMDCYVQLCPASSQTLLRTFAPVLFMFYSNPFGTNQTGFLAETKFYSRNAVQLQLLVTVLSHTDVASRDWRPFL